MEKAQAIALNAKNQKRASQAFLPINKIMIVVIVPLITKNQKAAQPKRLNQVFSFPSFSIGTMCSFETIAVNVS